MYKEHLSFLACPSCAGDLRLESAEQDEFIQIGKLCCEKCHSVFEIINGIPRFVPQSNYADSFGLQWNLHKKTQYDTQSGIEASEKRFLRETQWEKAKNGESCVILEAGCGSGRFTPYALEVCGGGAF